METREMGATESTVSSVRGEPSDWAQAKTEELVDAALSSWCGNQECSSCKREGQRLEEIFIKALDEAAQRERWACFVAVLSTKYEAGLMGAADAIGARDPILDPDSK